MVIPMARRIALKQNTPQVVIQKPSDGELLQRRRIGGFGRLASLLGRLLF